MTTPLMQLLNDPNSKIFWLCWAVMLVWQNYAFTFVSRARNSGSLSLHMKAAAQSNGVWFIQSLFVYSAFLKIITGEYGLFKAFVAGVFYMLFTMSGSFIAHMRALKKESGLNAVGANKKYAQIPIGEWEQVQRIIKRGSFDVIPQLDLPEPPANQIVKKSA